VDVNDIAEVLAQWTGIPVNQMMESEAERLLKMEDRLHERISVRKLPSMLWQMPSGAPVPG